MWDLKLSRTNEMKMSKGIASNPEIPIFAQMYKIVAPYIRIPTAEMKFKVLVHCVFKIMWDSRYAPRRNRTLSELCSGLFVIKKLVIRK